MDLLVIYILNYTKTTDNKTTNYAYFYIDNGLNHIIECEEFVERVRAHINTQDYFVEYCITDEEKEERERKKKEEEEERKGKEEDERKKREGEVLLNLLKIINYYGLDFSPLVSRLYYALLELLF